MKPVTIPVSATCPYCHRALRSLDSKGVSYQTVSVDGKPDVPQEMTGKTGQRTVPRICIGDIHAGGL